MNHLPKENSDLLIARRAARIAGRELMSLWKEPHVGIRSKEHALDFVSEADLASENIIKDILLGSCPNDSINSEESITHTGESNRLWLVDPIDGTMNFLRHNPLWSVGISLRVDNKTVCAVIYIPALEEEVYADASGCYLNGKKLELKTNLPLAEALVDTWIGGSTLPDSQKVVNTVTQHAGGMRCIGSGLTAMAWIAMGRIDAFLIDYGNPWDWYTGALCVQKAGGELVEDGKYFTCGTELAARELWQKVNLITSSDNE